MVTTNPTTANSPVTVASTYSADNQIAQAVQTSPQAPTQTITYAEDGNGSLTQAANSATGTTTYAYDFERRLTTVGLPNGTAVQFAYGPDGLRARKTGTSGTVTNYVLDGLQVLLEKDGTGTTQIRYAPGLARIASGTVHYYLEDRLDSIVGLTDANQVVTDTFRYDAWGNLIQQQGSTNPAYQWVGEEGYYLNPDAGLYLLGLRHYAPTMERFLTRDPLGSGNGYNYFFGITNYNFYNYVANNPINRFDPNGTKPSWAHTICCAAMWAGAAGICAAIACGCGVGTFVTVGTLAIPCTGIIIGACAAGGGGASVLCDQACPD